MALEAATTSPRHDRLPANASKEKRRAACPSQTGSRAWRTGFALDICSLEVPDVPSFKRPPPPTEAVATTSRESGQEPCALNSSRWRARAGASDASASAEDFGQTAEELRLSLCQRIDGMEERLKESFEHTLEAVLSRVLGAKGLSPEEWLPAKGQLARFIPDPDCAAGMLPEHCDLSARSRSLEEAASRNSGAKGGEKVEAQQPGPSPDGWMQAGAGQVPASHVGQPPASDLEEEPALDSEGFNAAGLPAEEARKESTLSTLKLHQSRSTPRNSVGKIFYDVVSSISVRSRSMAATKSVWNTSANPHAKAPLMCGPACAIEINEVRRFELITSRRPVRSRLSAESAMRYKDMHIPTKVMAHSQDHPSVLSLCCLKSVMHPNSRARHCWLILTLFALIYDVLMIPMAAFSITEVVPELSYVDMLLMSFWTLDMAVTFRTGYYVSSKVETSPRAIAKNYLKTWFSFDALVLTMGWASELSILGSGQGAFFKIARVFRVLRIFRLLRIAKLKQVLEGIEERINSNYVHLGFHMAKMVLGFSVVVHFASCIWYGIGVNTDNGWVSYENSDADQRHEDITFWYGSSLRWTLAQVNGETDSDERRNMYERMFTCFVAMALAVLLMAAFISSITAAIMELGSMAEERKKKLRRVNEFLKKNMISPGLAALIKRHVSATTHEEQEDDSKMLSYLPKAIQSDLLYEIRAPLLLRHPLFGSINHASKRVMWLLCNDAMRPVVHEKDAMIFDVNEFCSRMLILVSGIVLYRVPGAEGESDEDSEDDLEQDTVDVKSGRQISEAALWMEWHNCGRLTTVGMTSHAVALHASAFGDAVTQHLGVHAMTAMYARAFIEATKQVDELSDIMDISVGWE